MIPPSSGWPADSLDIPLRLRSSALVLIDMQAGYTDPHNVRGEWIRVNHPGTHQYFFDRIESVTSQLEALLALYRRRQWAVVHVTFGSAVPDRSDMTLAAHRRLPSWARSTEDLEEFAVGGSAHRIVSRLEPADNEQVFNKTSHSAFTSTAIESALRSLGISQLLVGGWATDACVGLTARDAADRGFETFLVEDACATFSPEAHESSVRNFGLLYGGVIPAATVHREATVGDC
jgi:biuret amidohydrolase